MHWEGHRLASDHVGGSSFVLLGVWRVNDTALWGTALLLSVQRFGISEGSSTISFLRFDRSVPQVSQFGQIGLGLPSSRLRLPTTLGFFFCFHREEGVAVC